MAGPLFLIGTMREARKDDRYFFSGLSGLNQITAVSRAIVMVTPRVRIPYAEIIMIGSYHRFLLPFTQTIVGWIGKSAWGLHLLTPSSTRLQPPPTCLWFPDRLGNSDPLKNGRSSTPDRYQYPVETNLSITPNAGAWLDRLGIVLSQAFSLCSFLSMQEQIRSPKTGYISAPTLTSRKQMRKRA